ncbi:MAG TPA: menaquinone biosynthesis protein [Nitrospinae bacterium]|nr:menaquinone biosynthesis protein [Nitrospinota bacterium]
MLKFGIHDFINAQPLRDALETMGDWTKIEVHTETPAHLADQLNRGELDLAMIPAIEYLKHVDSLRLLPGVSIASRNQVGTVLLVSKYPLKTIESLAIDNRSRTSVALLKLLFKNEMRSDLKWVDCDPNPEKMLEEHDAALIIGDPALGFKKEGTTIYDLSEEWYQRTGKTFVHAVIAVKEGVEIDERIVEIFRVAKQEGLMKIASTVRSQSRLMNFPEPLLLDYLQNKIRYNLGGEELDGLSHFQSLCKKAGLIEKKTPFEFAFDEETI